MNPFDILLIVLLAGGCLAAVLSIRRQKKHGKCSGGCAGCSRQCQSHFKED